MGGPCSGLTALDFSFGMSGALTTAVLADFGAEVVKVEPPTGDPYRSQGAWLAWNRGKKSIVLDPGNPGRPRAGASPGPEGGRGGGVLPPGVSRSLGIDYETLSGINPGLVYCSITGFGQKGRLSNLKDYEGIIAAKSGRMSTWGGQLDRPGPVYAAVRTATWAASQGPCEASSAPSASGTVWGGPVGADQRIAGHDPLLRQPSSLPYTSAARLQAVPVYGAGPRNTAHPGIHTGPHQGRPLAPARQ